MTVETLGQRSGWTGQPRGGLVPEAPVPASLSPNVKLGKGVRGWFPHKCSLDPGVACKAAGRSGSFPGRGRGAARADSEPRGSPHLRPHMPWLPRHQLGVQLCLRPFALLPGEAHGQRRRGLGARGPGGAAVPQQVRSPGSSGSAESGAVCMPPKCNAATGGRSEMTCGRCEMTFLETTGKRQRRGSEH